MVGRRGGKQVISLGTGCNVGSTIHEIGHALGLWHEQSRSDRDQYIEIVWENIKPNRESNFEKHLQDGKDWGIYDYDSIMHYTANSFGVNGAVTIRVKETGQLIGQRNGLSQGDINAVYFMYPDLEWASVAGFVPPTT
jgi:biotin-(acetyl-CoA carboxylase) ligase